MSEQQQQLREAIEHFNKNLGRYLSSDEDPLHDFWAEDVEFINFEPSPFPGTYRGHDGLRQWTRDLFGDLRESRVDALEIVEDGELMAVRMNLTGKGRSSGIAGTLEWGSLLTTRDGRCIQAASDVSFERTLERFEEERSRRADDA